MMLHLKTQIKITYLSLFEIVYYRVFSMDAKPSLLNPPGSILISSPIKANPLDLPQLQHRAAVIPPMVSTVVTN